MTIDTPISRAAVLEILRTPAASDTFPDMIRRVEALEGCGSSPPFHFDRYINGVLMAEGVTIERQPDMSSAMREAARLASRGPNGEVPVLVYCAALEPVAQPETPTPGQFTTMCLAIEDVVTGRVFDVEIPEEVKAYLRNVLMVGGWRGECD